MNYQQEQDKITKSLTYRPKLLLHSCCGPCSSSCIETLLQHFEVCVYWYNPNIYPESEYILRLKNQKKLIECMREKNEISFIEDEYNCDEYYNYVKGLENAQEGGERCIKCFEMRLEKAAATAKRYDFEWFTTTLTVSPHKNAEIINNIGRKSGEKYGIRFLPSDFKKKNGYLKSIILSKKYDIYRQNYCGCIFSKH